MLYLYKKINKFVFIFQEYNTCLVDISKILSKAYKMTDNRVYRTRTLGIPAEGMKDQYADGTAAKLWELYIGDKTQRTQTYQNFITNLLRERNCVDILDVACGTG